jgi:tetratricopeptide (TPR) repeat protein
MALDREKTFANAERLLKQGKTGQALEECKRLADDAPKDLLMLNRVGDFLARSNRGADAIVYYQLIADQFSASGFYPKAIAILKKIVKVDPGHLKSIVHLGELNLKQKLPGEARTWFLQAAEGYLRAREFAKAREVYEKLVGAEPDNVNHVVRLAEARAAEGDSERAGLELIALGNRMLAGGRTEDAERTFKRASELLPNRAEPIVGHARCQVASGKLEEGLRFADEAWERAESSGAVAGELFVLFESVGDVDRAERLLLDPKADAISDDSIEQVFRTALASGGVEGAWSRVLPLLDRWARAHQFDRSARLLERIARIEEGGHVRALEQLVEMRKAEGNKATAARAVERLIRVYQAKGVAAKVASQLETLKLFDPSSPLLFLERATVNAAPQAPAAAQAGAPPSAAPAASAAPSPAGGAAANFEAPAVPLGPADLEFVSGNLTEAEVFEKYGLLREALGQLRQITSRFPGHVVAQEKLVGFLRTQNDRGALRDGLVALALAKRASGDAEGARRAAAEAADSGVIEPATRGALERFGLLTPGAAKPGAAAQPAAARPAPLKRAGPPPPVKTGTPITRAEEEELELLFDDSDEAPAAAASAPGDALEEIEFYLGQGMTIDALNRIAEARAAGASDPALDALEARARSTAGPVDGESAEGEVSAEGEDRLDEDDLSSITAALEAQYGTDRAPEVAEPPAEPESEQSVEQVFETFKEHVKAAVDVGDFRTHYDLGIAYKEMGLIDDALAEFRVASAAPELYREACSMLGLCHWERGETEEAIRWHRAALEAPGSEDIPLSGLRYELAEKLEQTGDAQGAYELFGRILADDPGYRDVNRRVSELRSKLGL